MMVDPDKIADSNDMNTAISITTNRLHRRYRRFCEAADIRQSLWLYAWRKREQFAEYLSREDEAERKQGWSAVLVSLHRAGDRHCRKAKADQCGYKVTDEVFYSRAVIEELLAAYFNPGMTTNVVDDRVKVKSAPGSGYGLETSLADIDRALRLVDPEDRYVLLRVFGDGVAKERVGLEQGVTRSTVDRRISRAIKVMVEFLGGESPY